MKGFAYNKLSLRLKILVNILLFLVCLITSCLFSANLSDYKASQVFNRFFSDANTDNSYLSIANKGDNNSSFSSLYYNFFWTSLSSNCRRAVHDSSFIDELEGEEAKLYFQDYFTIEKNVYSGNRYYLHDGMFFTYFDNSIVSVNSVRFGCDGFILISDTLANELLKKYDIENNGIDSYKVLIENSQYAKLTYNFSSGITLSLCINNIIDSSKRVGARIREEHTCFGLTYYDYVKKLPVCFETDFKSNGYSPKALVDTIYGAGFNYDKADYSLIKKNEHGEYYKDEISSKGLNLAIKSKKNDIVFTALVVFSFVFYFTLVFIALSFAHSKKHKKDNSICGIVICSMSISFLVIQQIVDIYYLFSLIPTFFLTCWVIYYIFVFIIKRREGSYRDKLFEIDI